MFCKALLDIEFERDEHFEEAELLPFSPEAPAQGDAGQDCPVTGQHAMAL